MTKFCSGPIEEKIVEEARTWLGVRFKHQGRTRNGVDCVGLVLKVHEQLFGDEKEITGYERRPNQRMVYDLMGKHLIRIRPEEAQPGDVVLMAFDTGATHLGIISEKTIIHAYLQARKVVEQPLGSQRIVAYYRMKEVA